MSRVERSLVFSVVVLNLLPSASPWLSAQSNTRLLLAAGSGVPGHAGFSFGPFSNLAMNDNREIVFLSSLRGPRNELRAVVRSSGVSFSVVAFQGLRAPILKTSYDSFSAPSLNDAGAICFAAGLKDTEANPSSAIIRVDGTGASQLGEFCLACRAAPLRARETDKGFRNFNFSSDVFAGLAADGRKNLSGDGLCVGRYVVTWLMRRSAETSFCLRVALKIASANSHTPAPKGKAESCSVHLGRVVMPFKETGEKHITRRRRTTKLLASGLGLSVACQDMPSPTR